MSRGSSRRFIPDPKSVAMRASSLARARRSLNRGDHGLVAGAATEITLDSVTNLVLAGFGVLGQEIDGGHDDAGSAKPALQPVFLPERQLQRVQLSVRSQALDRRDLATFGLHREHGAALDRAAV